MWSAMCFIKAAFSSVILKETKHKYEYIIIYILEPWSCVHISIFNGLQIS